MNYPLSMKRILLSLLFSFGLLAALFSLTGCSSTKEPTAQELEKARYELCKDISDEAQKLFDETYSEGGIKPNDPRLIAIRDKYNLSVCQDYVFPDLDTSDPSLRNNGQ